MSLPPALQGRLRLPVIGAPLFIISHPALVIAQCKAGIVGAFPALNARPISQLDEWLHEITETLAAHDKAHPEAPSAPFAVNQIVHRSNTRLEEDLQLTVKWKAPIVITSLGAREDVNQAVKAYGGVTLHDVINQTFARKAIEKGATGLICVAAGAGGHAGKISPFAFVQETREWFDGPIVLSGAIATGGAVLAAQAMGADLAYIGSAFIATEEARAAGDYKQAIVEGTAADIIGSDLFTGVFGNYLRASIVERRARPRQSAQGRRQDDEFRERRRLEVEGLARHLGLRPGHRRGESDAAGGGIHRQAETGVRGGQATRGGLESLEPSAEVQQRRTVADARGLDPADDDGVGKALQDFLDPALQRRQRVGEFWRAIGSVAPGALREPLRPLRAAGEPTRQRLLRGGEDIDRETAARPQTPQRRTVALQVDDQRRRRQRQRGERGGDAAGPLRPLPAGDDRHAGGEGAHRLTIVGGGGVRRWLVHAALITAKRGLGKAQAAAGAKTRRRWSPISPTASAAARQAAPAI